MTTEMTSPTDLVIAAADLKLAGLLFRNVVTADYSLLQAEKTPEIDETAVLRILATRLNEEGEEIISRWRAVYRHVDYNYMHFPDLRANFKFASEHGKAANASVCSEWLPMHPVFGFEMEQQGEVDDVFDCLECLLRFEMIDTSGVTWEQVFECRRDVESHNALRRLRLFMHNNYLGKPRSFILDDLGDRLDRYDRAVEKHGFETRMEALTGLASSKALQATTLAATAGILLGEPLAAIVGGAGAASLELSSLSLAFARKKKEFEWFKRDHDLAFLIKLRRAGNH